MRSTNTKKPRTKRSTVEMRPEYDFSDGVRGKYAGRSRPGSTVVLLEPELAQAFPDSKSVNDALRAPLSIATRARTHKRS
jgi:hypothetical protein